MKRRIKSNNGMVLVLAIFIATFGILVITSLATLAYYNFVYINSTNNKSNAYYYADQGMEKTLKNLETILESAKIYADEKMRSHPVWIDNAGNVCDAGASGTTEYNSYYDYLTKSVDSADFQDKFKKQFEEYYVEYINAGTIKYSNGDDIKDANGDPIKSLSGIDDNLNSTDKMEFASNDSDLKNDQYKLHKLSGDIINGENYYGAVFKKIDVAGEKKYINPDSTNRNYKIDVTVTGWKIKNNQATFVRKVYAQVDINPWSDFNAGESSAIDLQIEKIYSSPQWASGIASSGDVVIQNGEVIVNGDIYVNGSTPSDSKADGIEYGGIVVGNNGKYTDVPTGAGTLTVNGNVFTNNYLHTIYRGSVINVNKRNIPLGDTTSINDTNYNTAVGQIYDRTAVDTKYSEKASNLNNEGHSDPLDLKTDILSSYGKKQMNSVFANYLADTYKIQKKYGGFVYANNVQIEPDDVEVSLTRSKINIAGSAIVYDNLETDGSGDIILGNNFYGFRDESRKYDVDYTDLASYITSYNQSSSLIVNNINSTIDIGQRIYNAGIAYVTAYGDPDGDGTYEPYETGETASLFKNYYAYRNPLNSVKNPTTGEMFSTIIFDPFNFVYFKTSTDPDAGESLLYKIAHVFKYNEANPKSDGPTISEGGMAYDTGMINLNSAIYATSLLSGSNAADMGFTRGVLVGRNGTSNDFIAVINPSVSNPLGISNYQSMGSLSQDAFNWYIKEKYSTLMEIKALKSINEQSVNVRELVDKDTLTADVIEGFQNKYLSFDSPAGYDANFVVVDGNITVQSNGSNLIIKGYDFSGNEKVSKTVTGNTYKGLILSTGKITVNSDTDINIIGSLISVTDPKNVGIVFKGSGKKTITYSKQIMLNIFRLPENAAPGAATVKELLTSKRGTVEMFRKIMQRFKATGKNEIADFASAIKDLDAGTDGLDGYSDADLETVANLYEIVDQGSEELSDVNNLSSGIVNKLVAEGKNYKILKWKTIQ